MIETVDTRNWKEEKRERERWRGRWKKRVLTGKNAQWGSKPAYQLTSNQMEGKSAERRGGSHRNRNSKVNIRRVDRKRGGAALCAATTGAEDKGEEKEDML